MKALNCAFGAALAFVLAFSAPARADRVEFDITGIGTGVLNGTSFSNRLFDIQMFGDNSTVTSVGGGAFSEIDPLNSANISIAGLGTSTFSIATRLGLNKFNVFFFS